MSEESCFLLWDLQLRVILVNSVTAKAVTFSDSGKPRIAQVRSAHKQIELFRALKVVSRHGL